MDRTPRSDLFKIDSFSVDGFACRRIEKCSDWARKLRWKTGQPITVPETPLRVVLESTGGDVDPGHDRSDHGPVVPDFFGANERVPIISRRVLAVLQAHADNFSSHAAVIVDPDAGGEAETHVAINVIGSVPNQEWRVDSEAIGSRRMFRLESYDLWIVDTGLRDALLAAGIETLRFRSLRACAGLRD